MNASVDAPAQAARSAAVAPSAVFHAMQHLCRRVFPPAAALQILAIPLGIAAVCALLRGQIHDCISAA